MMACNNASPIRNYSWKAGDTENITVRLKDSSGDIIDLTGATAQVQLRHTILDDTATLDKTVSAINDEDLGWIVDVEFTPDETEALVPDGSVAYGYVYDLELTDSSGDVTTVLSGTITVALTVTRG